jgi:hypothetical protein
MDYCFPVKCPDCGMVYSDDHGLCSGDIIIMPPVYIRCEKCTTEKRKKEECCVTENKPVDIINHPPHYNQSEIQPIDVIEEWQLGYHLGNVIKYICRCGHKGSPLEDLKKARWYLDRKIQYLTEQET